MTTPDVVVALALAGTLDFDPVADTLTDEHGEQVRLEPPDGEQLPSQGFDPGESGFVAPPADGAGVEVDVAPDSERLQLLEPFAPWDGNDYVELPVLMKATGQVHHRPHLGGGPVADVPRPPREHLRQPVPRRHQRLPPGRRVEAGHGKDPLDGETRTYPDIARHLPRARAWPGAPSATRTTARAARASTPPWSPGSGAAKVIFARSFARIHETNLKKQGVLALTFADPATYDVIGEDDRVSVLGLADLTPDVPVRCALHKPDGTTVEFTATHTMNDEQIEWFKAGSALNIIRGKHNT